MCCWHRVLKLLPSLTKRPLDDIYFVMVTQVTAAALQ